MSSSATPKRSGSEHFLEQDLGAFLLAELLHVRGDVLFEDVVAEDDDDLVLAGEDAGQAQGVGDAAFAFLVGVVDKAQAEVLAVAQQVQKIARIVAAGDEHDVIDPGPHQGLDRVVDHRLVVDRQQVLVGDLGQGQQTRAQTAGEDDTFHVRGGVKLKLKAEI